MSGLRQDVPALLPLPAVQRQRAAAVLLRLDRWRCVRDGLGAAAALPPAAGTHHPAGPHTGRSTTGMEEWTACTHSEGDDVGKYTAQQAAPCPHLFPEHSILWQTSAL